MKLFTGNEEITPVVQQLILPDQVKQEEGKEIKNQFLSFGLFFLVAFGILVIGYFTHSTITLVFGGIFSLGMFLSLIQTLIKKRVAGIMRRKVVTGRGTVSHCGRHYRTIRKSHEHPSFSIGGV